MIIKFKSKDTWVIFGEVDHVEYMDGPSPYDPVLLDHVGIDADTIVYDSPNDQAIVGKWVSMGLFTKNVTEATKIIACTPIYIMNDQGRTVETI